MLHHIYRIRECLFKSATLAESMKRVSATLESTFTDILYNHGMTVRMNQLHRGCLYALRVYKIIPRFNPISTVVILVNSILVSRVDCCNSILAALTDLSERADTVGAQLCCTSHIKFGQTPVSF